MDRHSKVRAQASAVSATPLSMTIRSWFLGRITHIIGVYFFSAALAEASGLFASEGLVIRNDNP